MNICVVYWSEINQLKTKGQRGLIFTFKTLNAGKYAILTNTFLSDSYFLIFYPFGMKIEEHII
jgi:hypothetical protein